MLGLGFLRPWMLLAVTGAALAGALWWYHSNLTSTIEELRAANQVLASNNSQLKDAISSSEGTVTFLQQSYDDIRRDYEELNGKFSEINSQVDQLQTRLSEHEIDVLALMKPGLVENIINRAGDKASRCFELLSGAPLNDAERNAENARQFNSECPWLYPGDSAD